MIVDSSAVVAVLLGEIERDAFAELLLSQPAAMSAATYLECSIVVDSHPNPALGRAFDQLLAAAGVDIAPVTEGQARIARAAYRDFGRGSGHLARLNFGDCFSYALAIERNEPLLFQGEDFAHTDVRQVLPG